MPPLASDTLQRNELEVRLKITKEELRKCLHKSMTDAEIAEKFDCSPATVGVRRRNLLREDAGMEAALDRPLIEGQGLWGVSSLYKAGEDKPALQWVKSKVDPAKQEAIIKELLRGAMDEVPKALPVDGPSLTQDSLLSMYVLTDFHLGMMAWREETGADWDLNIAEALATQWMQMAVARSLPAKKAVLVNLGDFLHWDGLEAVTPTSGHVLDADSRFTKLVRVAIRLLRKLIEMLLGKHEEVEVICAEGNHDLASSVWLRELLFNLYEGEERVTVNVSADPYYCVEHGNVSLFFHHGHLKRQNGISQAMAAKFREVWGRTKHSYAHVGHLHHTKQLEDSLMIVEQHRTLAAPDAYAARGAWLSGRSAPVITYHSEYGEVERHTISPAMLEIGE